MCVCGRYLPIFAFLYFLRGTPSNVIRLSSDWIDLVSFLLVGLFVSFTKTLRPHSPPLKTQQISNFFLVFHFFFIIFCPGKRTIRLAKIVFCGIHLSGVIFRYFSNHFFVFMTWYRFLSRGINNSTIPFGLHTDNISYRVWWWVVSIDPSSYYSPVRPVLFLCRLFF